MVMISKEKIILLNSLHIKIQFMKYEEDLQGCLISISGVDAIIQRLYNKQNFSSFKSNSGNRMGSL